MPSVVRAGAAPLTNATALVISGPMAVVEHDKTLAATERSDSERQAARTEREPGQLGRHRVSRRGIVTGWIGTLIYLRLELPLR